MPDLQINKRFGKERLECFLLDYFFWYYDTIHNKKKKNIQKEEKEKKTRENWGFSLVMVSQGSRKWAYALLLTYYKIIPQMNIFNANLKRSFYLELCSVELVIDS